MGQANISHLLKWLSVGKTDSDSLISKPQKTALGNDAFQKIFRNLSSPASSALSYETQSNQPVKQDVVSAVQERIRENFGKTVRLISLPTGSVRRDSEGNLVIKGNTLKCWIQEQKIQSVGKDTIPFSQSQSSSFTSIRTEKIASNPKKPEKVAASDSPTASALTESSSITKPTLKNTHQFNRSFINSTLNLGDNAKKNPANSEFAETASSQNTRQTQIFETITSQKEIPSRQSISQGGKSEINRSIPAFSTSKNTNPTLNHSVIIQEKIRAIQEGRSSKQNLDTRIVSGDNQKTKIAQVKNQDIKSTDAKIPDTKTSEEETYDIQNLNGNSQVGKSSDIPIHPTINVPNTKPSIKLSPGTDNQKPSRSQNVRETGFVSSQTYVNRSENLSSQTQSAIPVSSNKVQSKTSQLHDAASTTVKENPIKNEISFSSNRKKTEPDHSKILIKTSRIISKEQNQLSVDSSPKTGKDENKDIKTAYKTAQPSQSVKEKSEKPIELQSSGIQTVKETPAVTTPIFTLSELPQTVNTGNSNGNISQEGKSKENLNHEDQSAYSQSTSLMDEPVAEADEFQLPGMKVEILESWIQTPAQESRSQNLTPASPTLASVKNENPKLQAGLEKQARKNESEFIQNSIRKPVKDSPSPAILEINNSRGSISKENSPIQTGQELPRPIQSTAGNIPNPASAKNENRATVVDNVSPQNLQGKIIDSANPSLATKPEKAEFIPPASFNILEEKIINKTENFPVRTEIESPKLSANPTQKNELNPFEAPDIEYPDESALQSAGFKSANPITQSEIPSFNSVQVQPQEVVFSEEPNETISQKLVGNNTIPVLDSQVGAPRIAVSEVLTEIPTTISDYTEAIQPDSLSQFHKIAEPVVINTNAIPRNDIESKTADSSPIILINQKDISDDSQEYISPPANPSVENQKQSVNKSSFDAKPAIPIQKEDKNNSLQNRINPPGLENKISTPGTNIESRKTVNGSIYQTKSEAAKSTILNENSSIRSNAAVNNKKAESPILQQTPLENQNEKITTTTDSLRKTATTEDTALAKTDTHRPFTVKSAQTPIELKDTTSIPEKNIFSIPNQVESASYKLPANFDNKKIIHESNEDHLGYHEKESALSADSAIPSKAEKTFLKEESSISDMPEEVDSLTQASGEISFIQNTDEPSRFALSEIPWDTGNSGSEEPAEWLESDFTSTNSPIDAEVDYISLPFSTPASINLKSESMPFAQEIFSFSKEDQKPDEDDTLEFSDDYVVLSKMMEYADESTGKTAWVLEAKTNEIADASDIGTFEQGENQPDAEAILFLMESPDMPPEPKTASPNFTPITEEFSPNPLQQLSIMQEMNWDEPNPAPTKIKENSKIEKTINASEIRVDAEKNLADKSDVKPSEIQESPKAHGWDYAKKSDNDNPSHSDTSKSSFAEVIKKVEGQPDQSSVLTQNTVETATSNTATNEISIPASLPSLTSGGASLPVHAGPTVISNPHSGNHAQTPNQPVVASGTPSNAAGEISTEQATAQQIVKSLQGNISAERSHLNIRLVPESLGNISVHMTMENGTMRAYLIAEKESTRKMLDNNLSVLRSALDDQGIRVERLVVAKESMENRQPQDQAKEERNSERFMRGNGDANSRNSRDGKGSGQRHPRDPEAYWKEQFSAQDYYN